MQAMRVALSSHHVTVCGWCGWPVVVCVPVSICPGANEGGDEGPSPSCGALWSPTGWLGWLCWWGLGTYDDARLLDADMHMSEWVALDWRLPPYLLWGEKLGECVGE